MYVQYEKLPRRRHAEDLRLPGITTIKSDINIGINGEIYGSRETKY